MDVRYIGSQGEALLRQEKRFRNNSFIAIILTFALFFTCSMASCYHAENNRYTSETGTQAEQSYQDTNR